MFDFASQMAIELHGDLEDGQRWVPTIHRPAAGSHRQHLRCQPVSRSVGTP